MQTRQKCNRMWYDPWHNLDVINKLFTEPYFNYIH